MNLHEVSYELKPHPKWQLQMTMRLAPAQCEALAVALEKAFTKTELKLPLADLGTRGWADELGDVPQKFMSFWKVREGDSRIMIAHPEQNEWVVTVALERYYFEKMIEKLKAKASFKIESFCQLNRISNLHVVFEITPS